MDYQARLEKLRQILEDLGAELALVTRRDAVQYLCGFAGSFGDLLVTPKGALLITDGRYGTAAKDLADLVTPVIGRQGADLVPELLRDRGVKGAVVFDSDGVSVARFETWQRELPEVAWVPRSGLVDPLMAVKEPEEIERMAQACAITDAAWEEIQPELLPGVSEIQLAQRLAAIQFHHGATAHGFSIVASGPNSAIPHHVPSRRALHDGDLVKIDFGCVYEGYCSDLTRTVVLGEPSAQQAEVYEIVYRAQIAGCAAVRAGATGDEVDRAARQVIEEAGYGPHFCHGLGHGLGIAKHPPHVRPGYRLEVGNTITIEPGIYIEGWGGVRIEDLGVVTDEGFHLLSKAAKPHRLMQPGEWRT